MDELEKKLNAITFEIDGKWIIKISKEGFFNFNTEEFPGLTTTEFARAFVKIVENSFFGDGTIDGEVK